MGRRKRIYIDNCFYHITTRGNRKNNIFRERTDYERYLRMLKRAKKKYKVKILAYCLMSNHIHLMLYFKKAKTLSKFMQWLNQGYAVYFNNKYGKTGHLWEARFNEKPIADEKYLNDCAAYIEGNPIRAGISKNITDYEWSSYKERCLLLRKRYLDLIEECHP